MLVLLGTTFTASFFDSLNPSAIAQQMLLQAMVKNKRYIWFFIFGIGFTNLILGLAVYYGIAAWAARLLSMLTEAYPLHVYGAELLVGCACVFLSVRLIRRIHASAGNDTEENLKTPARLSPVSLLMMGSAFCAVELTSALPYFGFLALLTSRQFPFGTVLGLMFFYNFIYVLPLVLLYFGYNRLQSTALIQRLERMLNKISAYVVPVIVSVASVLLIFHGAASLI